MWELDHKENWALKSWCFWTVVLEKTLESPLDCKEIKSVNPKGDQSWLFIGRTDAGVPMLWPPDAKNWLTGKDPDAGKDWRREEKGTKEDDMVGWNHRLDGHEFEQLPGAGEGQGSLACCSPWGNKEPDITERLNWSPIKHLFWLQWYETRNNKEKTGKSTNTWRIDNMLLNSQRMKKDIKRAVTKTPSEKWKRKYKTPNPVECSESGFKRGGHSSKHLKEKSLKNPKLYTSRYR